MNFNSLPTKDRQMGMTRLVGARLFFNYSDFLQDRKKDFTNYLLSAVNFVRCSN